MLDVARIAYLLVLEDCFMGNTLTFGRPGIKPVLKILDQIAFQEDVVANSMADKLSKVKEIIYAAGLLHDMARWVEYETGEDHAAAGARTTGVILDQAGFNEVEQSIIAKAIGEHRTGGTAASPLGQYICRADDLARPCSRCGARDDCYKINRMETAGLFLY